MNNPYFNVPEEDVITTTAISIENVDGSYTLYDRGIVSDSMSLSRILCSSGLNFGETNSSKFEFQMYDIPDITNRFIKVIRRQKYNDSVVEASVFTGYVDSFKSEIDSTVKTIIAYDIWYFKKDLNIAGWIDEFLKDYKDDYLKYATESQYYNGVTLSQLQEHLFTYFNIPYETLDNDFIVIPPLTAFGQSSIAIIEALSGLKSTILNFNTLGEIVFAINEVNASFGYIDPDGNYVHKKLQNTFDNLNPAKWNLDTKDIDISGTDIDFNNIIPSIDMVKYTDSSGETLTMGDTDGNVIYELSSNPLLAYHTTTFTNQWELSTYWIYDYQQRLHNIYTEITNVTYYVGSIPLKLSSPPTDKGISLGDSISVYLGENITGIMYAMQLDYSGSQLYDETISTVANTAGAGMSITTSSPPVSSEGGSSDYASFAGTANYAKKLKNPVNIDGINFDGSQSITHYGVCDTDVTVPTKIITTDYDFVLEKGVIIKFLTKNPIADVTFIALNVNGTGAKDLFQSGHLGFSKIYIDGYSMVECVYDGTYWRLLSMVYREATASSNGLMTSVDKLKLNGIAEGAEVNQNAFSNLVVGSTTVSADSKTDTLTLVGNNVTLTPDATNDKVTIGITEGNVTTALGYTPLNQNLKGANSGLAELDANGKVPSSQLPSYIDDVLEYSAKSSFPSTGETGKIYVDTSTNLTYRWSGSAYVEISPSLALGETSSTAYRGDRGKTAYDHSQSAHAPSNAQANVIETVKVNGTALTPSSKAVNVTVPTKVSDLTNDSGYTTNTGTITEIKMNGSSKGTSGVVDLGTVITAHQDISGKSDVGHKHTKSEITDFPTSMTPTAHNQASNTINAMTGYSKPSSTSVITTSDSLNSAIGKLEKALDSKGSSNFSGSYNDLSDKPTIPSVGNGTITITQNGTTKGTFTTNQSGDTTIALTDTDTNTTYGVATSSALGLVKSGTDITVDSSGNVSVNDDSHNHIISNVDGLQSALDNKLSKTTYEYNKELDLGSSGKVCIGVFPCYDSNISVEIKSTTNTTYNGTLVIATQNINTTGGGVYTATVYGDENNTLTSAIRIQYLSGSNAFSVYMSLPDWSKNILHIQCVALAGTPSSIATTVDSIPSTATIVPTNAFTHNHDDRYYTESEIDSKLSGKANTSHTHSNYLTGITKAMVTNALGYTPPTSDTDTWRPLGTTADTACAGNDSRLSYYGTCDTSSSTVTKVVSIDSGFKLVTGSIIKVKMTYDNLISVPQLNVNGTGAKAIKYTSGDNSAVTWEAGSILEFVYDGTYWILTNVHHIATTSEKGFMSATDKTKLNALKLIEFVNVNLGPHTFPASTGTTYNVDVSASIPEGYTLVAAIPKGTGNNNLYYYWMGVISSTTIQYQCRNVSTSAQKGTQVCQIICVKQ